jgi:hypothetical protein
MHALKTWLVAVIFSAILVGLCRLSRWLYLLTIPVSLLWLIQIVGVSLIIVQNWNGYTEVSVGEIFQRVCIGALPIISLGVYGYYDFRYRRVA